MIDNYINTVNVFLTNALFFCFKYTLIALVTLTLISLILLCLGCLIKSQKLKSKFLIVVPSLIVGTIILLAIPYIVVLIKNSL